MIAPPAATIRQLVVRRFSVGNRAREPDDELADALYFMLRMVNVDVAVDGWALFRVTQEASDCLTAIGLMTLLPDGSVPIAVSVRVHNDGLAWSAQLGRNDFAWSAIPESKRWKSVYLHASGDLNEPPWTWGPTYQGVHGVQMPDNSLERMRGE
jgi:hypothetical protein